MLVVVLVMPPLMLPGLDSGHTRLHTHTHNTCQASMKSALLLIIMMMASCCRAIADPEDAEEELKERIGRKARLLTEAEGFDISALPVLSSSLRNTSTCPGVEEEVKVYR